MNDCLIFRPDTYLHKFCLDGDNCVKGPRLPDLGQLKTDNLQSQFRRRFECWLVGDDGDLS